MLGNPSTCAAVNEDEEMVGDWAAGCERTLQMNSASEFLLDREVAGGSVSGHHDREAGNVDFSLSFRGIPPIMVAWLPCWCCILRSPSARRGGGPFRHAAQEKKVFRWRRRLLPICRAAHG